MTRQRRATYPTTMQEPAILPIIVLSKLPLALRLNET
jgi:hypothetical protein